MRRFLQVEFIVSFDADGQHNVEDISKFHKAFTNHPELEVIFGSRFLGKQTHDTMPLMRKIILIL